MCSSPGTALMAVCWISNLMASFLQTGLGIWGKKKYWVTVWDNSSLGCKEFLGVFRKAALSLSKHKLEIIALPFLIEQMSRRALKAAAGLNNYVHRQHINFPWETSFYTTSLINIALDAQLLCEDKPLTALQSWYFSLDSPTFCCLCGFNSQALLV